jgi:hypothetical protein
MKNSFGLACIACSLTMATAPVSAEILTFEVSAHVDFVYDMDNSLNGQVVIGQAVKGTYSYDTSVLDENPSPESGAYPQSAQQGRVSFPIGSMLFESDPSAANWMFHVGASMSTEWGLPSVFQFFNEGIKPLSNGLNVAFVGVSFFSYGLNGVDSEAILTQAPDVSRFQDRRVHISGTNQNGNWYSVSLLIDSVRVLPSLVTSPSHSTFIRQQTISPALIGVSPIGSVSALINGVPVSNTYTQQCQISPMSLQGRSAITCPDIVPLLAVGNNQVEWLVNFADGSTATTAVDWQVLE